MRVTRQPLAIRGGRVAVPEAPGLGVELDMKKVAEAHKLYQSRGPHQRDDAAAMQFLAPGWTFDPNRPVSVRPPSGGAAVENRRL